MEKYKCTICGMEINENNYNLNFEAFIENNRKDNIIYCPFCGAGKKYIVDAEKFKAAAYESLNNETITILDHASKLEVFNSDFYEKASKLAKNEDIKNIFKALSNIELMHARVHAKYAGLSKLPVLRDIDYSKLKGDDVLLKLASGRERHAVEFYNKYIKPIESEEIKRIIKALSDVEKDHIILTGGSI